MDLTLDRTDAHLGATPDALAGLYAGPATALAGAPPARHDAARAALAAYDVRRYASTRNHLDGNVSRLNPYVTWGALTLREVLTSVRAKHGRMDRDLEKFVDELGWKAFFREGFRALGGRVYRSLEPYKYPTAEKLPGPPPGVEVGDTGLPCMDRLLADLAATGYLHNHGRLWLAGWWVHYAGHAWEDGERFLYRRLLDGEPGPNALSWQWVASTFGGKPYVFDGANLRRFGLEGCDGAPFDTDRDTLDRRFFGGYAGGGYARRPKEQPRTVRDVPVPRLRRGPGDRPVVVLHAERLSPHAAALDAAPGAPVVVTLDARRLREEGGTWGRVAFAAELALDAARALQDAGRDASVHLVEAEADLAERVRALGGASVVTPGSWHPGTWRTLARLDEHLPVSVVEDAPFAQVDAPLRSFSAYWKVARPQVVARFD
mgnify:FL=1